MAEPRGVADLLDGSASVAAFVGAGVLATVVAADGPVEIVEGWFVVDRLAAAWTVFAVVVVVAIRSFGRRQLAGDPDRERFRRASAFAAISGVALFWAANLAVLAVTAATSSVAAAALVDGRRPGRRAVARSTLATLFVGDAALALAAVIVAGDGDGVGWSDLGAPRGALVHGASLLVVAAALVRCAQVPAHRWLPRTLVAPTPVSAMLHAGLVNAGGVILVRTAPLTARSTVAVAVGLVFAVASIVVGSAVMRGRSEVKTALVWSTTAQMGFMLVQALVGLGAAAAAHLIAHGAYKASLFLTSGSTLERPVRVDPRRDRRHRVAAVVLAAAVTVVAVVASDWDVDAHGGAAWLIVAFAALTVFAVLDGPAGTVRGVTVRSVTGLVGLGLAAYGYLELLGRFESWLHVSAPVPEGALAWTLGVVAVIVIGAVATSPGAPLPAAVGDRVAARVVAVARRPVLDVVSPRRRGPVGR